ncbi:LANO_0H03532g1_1 [Lachancea nothofagi CBS 11611]|uniref:Phosphatidylserine decarboxylase proenzyme 1, mitochondrial n=1 Tax=Lachancea nothofagi CBS 11611 TaxID=1266666 RepID=A0A1G4KL93_9SACH|nr:LANO_0H03532g1_1 [Lachancea nothofagi CBS 11611]
MLKTGILKGSSGVKGRLNMYRFGGVTGMRIKNRTAHLWNHRFYSSRPDLTKFTGYNKQVVVKLVVMTGVTLVLGSILFNYAERENEDLEERTEDGERDGKSHSRPKIKIFNNNWLFFWYSTLPLNAMSRLWGQVNSLTLPVWLRPWGFRFYAAAFGANLDEMQDPVLEHYQNLSEFFYREIKPESRPIAPGDDVVVCPSDGKVLQLGIIDAQSGDIQQVKGMTYSVREFLGTHAHPHMTRTESQENIATVNSSSQNHDIEFARINNIPYTFNDMIGETPGENHAHLQKIEYTSEGDKSLPDAAPSRPKTMKLLSQLSTHYVNKITGSDPKNTKLCFAVIYLAPGDYHHYHSPVNWVCKLRRHFPGELFSVAPYFQRNFPNLFVLNERVALLGHWKHGFFSMTPVGATNVGSIKLNFDKELVTNGKRKEKVKPHTCYEATYENTSSILGGVPLVKGEEMGGFMLGSTVVLCFEASNDFEFNISVGQEVKMGQSLGESK